MEIKITADYSEEMKLDGIIDELQKRGFFLIRKAGGIMPNHSGWYAELRRPYK